MFRKLICKLFGHRYDVRQYIYTYADGSVRAYGEAVHPLGCCSQINYGCIRCAHVLSVKP